MPNVEQESRQKSRENARKLTVDGQVKSLHCVYLLFKCSLSHLAFQKKYDVLVPSGDGTDQFRDRGGGSRTEGTDGHPVALSPR